MAADDVRYQQTSHGFTKLSPVVRTLSGWRAATATESPDAVVSRVFGPNNFAIVVSGEIDGLTGLGAIGSTFGSPVIGRVVSASSVLVNLQSYGTSANSSILAIQLIGITDGLTSLNERVDDVEVQISDLSDVVDTKADAAATTTSLNNRVLNYFGGGVLDIDIGAFIFDDVNYTQVTE